MNDNANLHQILIADPIRIIAKSNSSTSINAKAIKVRKPDLVPPSNERNKNSEKENGNELHVVEYEDGNIFRDKFFEKENKEGNNSMEKDNRSKMDMEEKSITEEDAKRRKLDHEFYSIQDYNALKSDKENDQDMSSIYDSGILDMMKTTAESREKNQLPNFFTNCSHGSRNSVLRFDDIGTTENGFSVIRLIPKGLRKIVVQKEDHSQGSKHYGFVNFRMHEVALSFINKFNKLKIPGTDLTYNLSWAPFKCRCCFMRPIDGSEGNQFDVPQVGVLKALEMKTQYKADEIAAGLEKLFSELDDQAHSGTDASAFWIPSEEEKFAPFCWDDGFTTTLVLHHLDHVLEKDQITRVVEKYGKCHVVLPPGGGSATVTFSDRSSAVSASKDLTTALVDRGICGLSWGIEIGGHPRDDCAWMRTLPCYICGSSCPKGQKSVN